MNTPLRFGILGTGNIAGQFARDLASAMRSTVVAVGSRRLDSAESFAADYGIATAHGSYDALLADDQVEAVYVSLPNSLHHQWSIAALAAGKHVLCEKPFATSLADAQAMYAAADAAQRIIVEAIMYRSHPLTTAVLEQVQSGAIGQVRMLRATFCYRAKTIAGNVRFDRELAGGALMDIGLYCVDFCHLFADAEPTQVHVVAHLHATGVDEQTAAVMHFANGIVAEFVCGLGLHMDNTAFISGDKGYINIPIPWKPPVKQATFTVTRADSDQLQIETFRIDADRPLYALEADDFAAAVHDAAPLAVSRDATLANMRILDELRRQVGLPF
jgi:predicted dehydrogenase